METTTGGWFYYPQTDKWYRFIDSRDENGKLLSRVCQESETKPGKAGTEEA